MGRRKPLALIALTIAAGALLAAPATAAADPGAFAGVSGGEILDDPAGDTLRAPDLRRIVAFRAPAARYGVAIRLDASALEAGEAVITSLDTDADAATGDPDGADLSVWVEGGEEGTPEVHAERWSEDAFDSEEVALGGLEAVRSGATEIVWSAPAARIGIAGATSRLAVASLRLDEDDEGDLAPDDGGMAEITTGFLTGSWPVGPGRMPRGGAGPRTARGSAPAVPAGSASARRALAVPGFTIGRTGPRRVSLAFGWSGGRDRVRWALRLSTRIDGHRVTRLVRGAGLPATDLVHRVRRIVAVPAAWRGRTAHARLRVSDGARTITRERRLRIGQPTAEAQSS